MNTCPTEPRLTACLLGDLPKAEADAVHTHLESCPACRAAAAELAPLLDTLRAALASDAAAPLTLDPVRLAAILATPPPHRARRRRTRFWLAPVIGLAATLVIILSAALFFSSFESRPYRVPKGSGTPQQTGPFIGSEHKEAADGDAACISDETEFRAGEKKPVVVNKPKKRPIVDGERDLSVETDTKEENGWTSEAWIKDGRGDKDDTYSVDSKAGHGERVDVTGRAESDSNDGGIAHEEGKIEYRFGGVADPKSGQAGPTKHDELKIAENGRLMLQKKDGGSRASPGERNAIVFWFPELENSSVAFEEDKAAQVTDGAYVGRVLSKDGKMGVDGGRTGGWPDGMQDGIVRYRELTRKFRNGEKPDTPAMPDPPTPVPAPAAPPKATSTPVKPRGPAVFNPFIVAAEQPLSTFAIDVDTASYTRTRQAILAGQLPEPEAVRTEEVVNAFDYGDRAPDHATFRIFVEGSPAPFGHGTSLVRLGIKGRRLGREEARPAVLTFVVDASGSMARPDRFGLARLALDELLGRLGPDDRIQLIAFNDTARVLADPVAPTGRKEILAAFDRIQCTGSTHLEAGLRLAYGRAAAAFRPGAENRVILISDGVANLGTGAAADILTHIDAARRQGITLAVFGVGRGTYNDEMLEQLANRGDGTYRFLDSADEVRRAFVDDLAATLYNIASDVKIQVEWLPAAVSRYRQLGYENRALTAEQFRDDTVDAGEVGSGQSVTALYEIERAALAPRAAAEVPLGMVRVRYRPASGGPVAEISRPILAADLAATFQSTRPQFRLAACAAAFAERLRGSPYANGFSFADVANALRPAVMEFTLDARLADLLRLIETADRLTK
jgi:Ca-activated chloride channel family protein